MLVATPKLQNCKIFAGKRLGGTESKITQKGLDLLKGKPFDLIGLPTAAILAVASASSIQKKRKKKEGRKRKKERKNYG